MNKLLEIALGVVTAVGGFLEIGSIATAAQAGAEFRFAHLWTVALGGLCIAFLVEMSGRFAAVSHHPVPAALRERFGFPFFAVALVGLMLITWLVLAAEIGGACVAFELATGIAVRWWVVPMALLTWGLLWKAKFGFIEKGVSLLGLITVCFVIAAYQVHPPWTDVGGGLIPAAPQHDAAHYWFIAVSILGASISPYLFYFYSAGAIEDRWRKNYLAVNRIIAAIGMGFGTLISMAVLIVAAMVFAPRHIAVQHYDQLALMLLPVFGHWGFVLLAASLFVACLGAALELSLEIAYFVAQGFGWSWGENKKPIDAPRFSLAYTLAIALAAALLLIGIDPLQLTILSMALTAAVLPLATLPLLQLMNDRAYMQHYGNGWLSNAVVTFIVVLGSVLAIVTIPLEILGG